MSEEESEKLLSKKTRIEIAKEIEKQLEKQVKDDNKIVNVLNKNKGKLKKIPFKFKTSLWIDTKTREKSYGATIELLESKSKYKVLNGWNLDVGITERLDALLGISKDFSVLSTKEWSLGGYISMIDTGKQLYNRIFKKSKDTFNISVKIGLGKKLF